TIAAGPSHGALTPNGAGVYTYTPALNYNGTDSFTYYVTDRGDPDNCTGAPSATCAAALPSATKTVTLTVTAVNDAPVNYVPGAQATNEDTPLVFSNGNV